jgi:hypothetical protein
MWMAKSDPKGTIRDGREGEDADDAKAGLLTDRVAFKLGDTRRQVLIRYLSHRIEYEKSPRKWSNGSSLRCRRAERP